MPQEGPCLAQKTAGASERLQAALAVRVGVGWSGEQKGEQVGGRVTREEAGSSAERGHHQRPYLGWGASARGLHCLAPQSCLKVTQGHLLPHQCPVPLLAPGSVFVTKCGLSQSHLSELC